MCMLRQVRSHQDQRQEAKVKKRRDISNTSAGPGGRQDSRERGARSPASKHRHAAAAGPVPAALHTHARVWPLSADREHGRGDLHDRRPDASVAEGGSTRPVPASRGFTLWCRSRTATSSFGRQALERTTGSSSTGFIGTAWSTSRGTRAGPPAGQRHIDCICVPLHAAEHRVFVPCV